MASKQINMHNPLSGVGFLFAGFRLMFKARLRMFVWLPLLINIILFGVGFYWLWHKFTNWMAHFISWLPHWLHWLDWLFWPLFVTLVLAVSSYLFTIVANLLAAPFNGLFSQRVEEYLRGEQLPSTSVLESLKDAPRIIGRQLEIIFYYLPRALGCLILFVIPLTHIFASPAWSMLNAWMMALQYNDYPMDNHKVPFKDMRAQMRKGFGTNFGFGFATLFLSMVPIVNLFVMPAAIAGATKMWVESHTAAPLMLDD